MKKNVVMLLNMNYIPSYGLRPKIKNEAQTLLSHGFDVSMVCWDRALDTPEEDMEEGMSISRVRIKTTDSRGPFQLVKLIRFLARAYKKLSILKPDAIHCHNIDVLPSALFYKLRHRRVKVVLDAHEPDYYALWPAKYRPFLYLIRAAEWIMVKRIDVASVVNDYQVEKYRGMGVEKVIVVGNYPASEITVDGIDESKFGRETCTFGRLGTMYADCGIEQSLAAFRSVHLKYPNSKLFLAGTIKDNFRSEFDDAINKYLDNDEKNHETSSTSEQGERSISRSNADIIEYDGVEVMGPFSSDDVKALSERIDVALMLYIPGAWFKNITPTKFYDNLANAIPMIMSDIGGLGKVIKEHQLGIVVDPLDESSVASAMERMISDIEFRRSCALNCLEAARNIYNWDEMDKLLSETYKDMLASR